MSQEESTGLGVAQVRDVGGSGGRAEPARSPQVHRFRVAVVVLGVLALVALAIAGFLATGRTSTGGETWSAWSPPDGGLAGAQEIADFLAPYYRATPGQQLAVVTTVNLNDPNHPLEVVVPASGSGATGSLVPLPANNTIVYNLCGEGTTDCSIGAGKPSQARLLLLRREALELALYTFRYISGVQTVVAVLPPSHTVCTGLCPKPPQDTKPTKVQLALAFDHSELQPWLDHPLSDTLPGSLPPTVSEMEKAPEAELVSIITAHGLFSEREEQAQDGSQVIVLSPMAPQ
jgi:hypothetical protein